MSKVVVFLYGALFGMIFMATLCDWQQRFEGDQ